MENDLLPATSFSMTGLAVGQSRCGVAFLWGAALHVLTRGSLTAMWYRDEIPRPLVRPYAGAVGPGFILMQDNASCGWSVSAVPARGRH